MLDLKINKSDLSKLNFMSPEIWPMEKWKKHLVTSGEMTLR